MRLRSVLTRLILQLRLANGLQVYLMEDHEVRWPQHDQLPKGVRVCGVGL